MGAGASITWSKERVVASALFISEDAGDSTKGFLQDNGRDHITTQLALVDESYTMALAYTNDDSANTDGSANVNDYTSYGISGTYKFSNDSAVLAS